MEFVGNRINIKTVLATLTAAFLVGRINLFGGSAPAAVALITVMMAVSTVYIYIVPVMAAAMLTYIGQGMTGYGDMLSLIFCGVFFLFFHNQRFSINQRTAIAAAATVILNCVYYSAAGMIYLLDARMMLEEIVALIIYIRVFNTIARALFTGREMLKLSEDKIWISLVIFFVSVTGAFGVHYVVIGLWIFLAVVTQYCKGIQGSLAFTAVSVVYWYAMNGDDTRVFSALFTGLVAGWFLASLFDGKYRKTIMALAVFAPVAIMANQWIYSAAVATAVFIAVPPDILTRVWHTVKDRMIPGVMTASDMKLENAKRNLTAKKKTFSELSKIHGGAVDKRQIISYQFDGMSRAVDEVLQDLDRDDNFVQSKKAPPIAVGSASYAFEEVSGDSSISFSFGRDNQALIISDGMGKGSKASAESKLVVTTLSKLLAAGFDVDIAIKTVNAVLMTGNNSDMFATVDLAIINKRTGRAQIFKMGAASTFVKHNGKVSILKRPAPPVGIVEGLKLGYIDVHLRKGDMLIMVSDGVTDCDRQDPGCLWLRRRLEELGSRDPETVAELIVNKAAEKYGIKERDDLTVMVAGI